MVSIIPFIFSSSSLFSWSSKVKLATVDEGDQKAPSSKLLHWGVGEGATPFPGLLHFTLDTYLILLSVKQGGIKYHFLKSLVWRDLGLNPGSLGPLANTLPTRPMSQVYGNHY